MDARLLQIILPLLIILPILYWRMRKAMKPQPLKPGRLLIRPAFIIVVAIMLMAASPPPARRVPLGNLVIHRRVLLHHRLPGIALRPRPCRHPDAALASARRASMFCGRTSASGMTSPIVSFSILNSMFTDFMIL